VSFLQTADGGLKEIQDHLIRARELATQGANEIHSSSARESLDQEFQMLLANINRIVEVIETPSGQTPLGGAIPGVQTIDELFTTSGGTNSGVSSGLIAFGYIPGNSQSVDFSIDSGGQDDDIQIFTRSGIHVAGTNLTDGVWSGNGINNAAQLESALFTPANGFYNNATYDSSSLVQSGSGTVNGISVTYTGEQQPTSNAEAVQLVNIGEPLLIFVIGNGSFSTTASWQGLGAEGAKVKMTELGNSMDSQGTFDIDPAPADTGSLQLYDRNLLSIQGSQEVLDALDLATDLVAGYRADYGMSINALGVQHDRAIQYKATLGRSRMLIDDANFAEETSQLARIEIQKSLSSSMLAQTRQIEEMAL
jgi:flagellin